MWFTYDDLRDVFLYDKIQSATTTEQNYINDFLIPHTQDFIQSFTQFTWNIPPGDILRVAKNYTVNRILADDENIRIALARGQPSFEVAGGTVTLDLSPGRNPFLSVEDEAILLGWQLRSARSLHVDKVRVKAEGNRYRDATGRTDGEPLDYLRPDLPPDYRGGIKP